MEYLFPNIALIFSVMKFIDDTRYFIFTRANRSNRSRDTDLQMRVKKEKNLPLPRKKFPTIWTLMSSLASHFEEIKTSMLIADPKILEFNGIREFHGLSTYSFYDLL